MHATGTSQRKIADALGISQSAVSQQLKAAPDLGAVHPALLLDAATPVLRALAAESGFQRLAVFGSVARGEARSDSDIDLIVQSPEGASSFDFVRFQLLLEHVLSRSIDLVDYGGLRADIDDDILRDARPL